MIHMTRLTIVSLLLFTVSSPAMAYIGPGAGLSLLGALWGLVAAVGAALLFILIWPFRRMMRRKREAKKAEAESQQNQQNETTHDTTTHQAAARNTTVNKEATHDPTARDAAAAVHDDEKKPSDVGTR